MEMKLRSIVSRIPAAAGVIGAMCLVAGLGLYLITSDFDTRVQVLLAVGVALLFLTASYYPHEVAGALRGRSARYGSNTLAMIVIFVSIIAMLNFLSTKRNYRWDLTESGEYSLSPQTISLLGKLQEPVKVTAFYAQGAGQEQIQDLLKEYRRHSDKIEYEFVDPELKPGVARQYNIQSYGTTVVEYKGKRQDVMGATEQDLTAGLFKLVREKAPKVYFLTGHGEADPDGFDRGDLSQLKSALQADNYEVAKLTLATTGSVPQDAAAIIIAGPKTPFLEDEKNAIKAYLENHGKALILLEARGPDSLNDVLKSWGVEVGDGVVIDPASSLAGQAQVPVVLRYGQSPITRDLVSMQLMTLLPLATSVAPSEQPPEGVSVTGLMQTSDRAWLEKDPQVAQFDEGVDTKGPLSLAVAVEGSLSPAAESQEGSEQPADAGDDKAGESQSKTRLVVIGNVNFAANDLSGEPAIGNRDLFLNSVSWLVEEEDMISIRAKEPQVRTVFLSNEQANFVFFTSVIFLPLAVLAVGGVVWWNRR